MRKCGGKTSGKGEFDFFAPKPILLQDIESRVVQCSQSIHRSNEALTLELFSLEPPSSPSSPWLSHPEDNRKSLFSNAKTKSTYVCYIRYVYNTYTIYTLATVQHVKLEALHYWSFINWQHSWSEKNCNKSIREASQLIIFININFLITIVVIVIIVTIITMAANEEERN